MSSGKKASLTYSNGNIR
uniref:Uncharacterized protein n=1 Tax=Rhizophora mucronata TaxID=61149 RepID=A0A2P2NXS1_RHIMU